LTANRLELSVQNAAKDSEVPKRAFFENCAVAALAGAAGELVIRIVDEPESAALNERYRNKPGPTNVLAFPAGDVPVPDAETRPIGDVVICAAVVVREAVEQGKLPEAHWAHVVIHGCLHLLGFDHEAEDDAREMESREAALLAELGIGDPYQSEY
jgi:probable rRNA maturation factor